MDINHFKKLLLKKEQELLAAISRLEAEARDARQDEVEDPMDRVVSDEGRATAFQESTLEWQTLTQVRDAVRRIEEGTYGKCIDCARDIEPARLEAVPWTPYCLNDQEKHDREKSGSAK